MNDQEDKELERINRRKLEERMKEISGRAGESGHSLKASGKPLDLTDATFKKFTEDNPLTVVDCWAPWCGP
ncbi:hypothetical protein KA005_33085, partial [bacterium]|nr:hypothetical protein [bacterium]